MNDLGIVLFSTEYCTLCEQALDMLISMPELQGRSLRVVDVATDAHLLRQHGERLPVVQVGERELAWPFGRDEISAVLREIEQN